MSELVVVKEIIEKYKDAINSGKIQPTLKDIQTLEDAELVLKHFLNKKD